MPAPTPTPTPQAYDPTRDAESYRSLVWEHINKRILAFLGNHHYNHEPGGKDELVFPLGGLSDVTMAGTPTVGDALVYMGTAWANGTTVLSGGGASYGQAFFETAGTVTLGIIPGPMNLGTASLNITRVLVESDGEVSGEITAGGAFAFAAGGGTEDNDDLTYEWTNGSRLNITISAVGADPTYLTADVYFTGA